MVHTGCLLVLPDWDYIIYTRGGIKCQSTTLTISTFIPQFFAQFSKRNFGSIYVMQIKTILRFTKTQYFFTNIVCSYFKPFFTPTTQIILHTNYHFINLETRTHASNSTLILSRHQCFSTLGHSVFLLKEKKRLYEYEKIT